MRRWFSIFLASFSIPMAIVVYVSTRDGALDPSAGAPPILGTSPRDLPPKGTQIAEGPRVRVYEGEKELAEISGREAVVEGRRKATVRGALLTVYPEPSRDPRLSENVVISSDTAEIDTESKLARLDGQVRVATGSGSTAQAHDLIVNLREKLLTSEGHVRLESAESFIRGTGFHGAVGLRSFRFDRDVAGSFFGTSADWTPGAVARPGAPPQDVTFTAGGPVTVDDIEDAGGSRRTRVVLDGGVHLLRVDPLTEFVTRIDCRTLTLLLARPESPASLPDRLHKIASTPFRLFASTPSPPVTPATPVPSVRVESFEATGDVRIVDARAEIEADRVTMEAKADGSAVTRIHGVRKRLVFRKGDGITFDPLGAAVEGQSGPMELTCIDDIVFLRRAGTADQPGTATATMARWVELRDGSRTLTADKITLELLPVLGEKTGTGFTPRSLEAEGNVLMKEENPVGSARADRLKWEHATQTLRLQGKPKAEVVKGDMIVRAHRILFDNRRGIATFDGDVVATGQGETLPLPNLQPQKTGNVGPWELRCRRLETEVHGDKQLDLSAAGDLVITSEDTVATGDVLKVKAGYAWLIGEPARITQGENLIEARTVLANTVTKTATLHGVHQVVFHLKGGMRSIVGIGGAKPAATDEPAKPTPVVLRSRGPVYVDQEGGLMHARGGISVEVPAEQVRLDADRLRMDFDPKTRALRTARADGSVFLRSQGMSATGRRLVHDEGEKLTHLVGDPRVHLWQDGRSLACTDLYIHEGGKKIRAISRGSKGRLSFPDDPGADGGGPTIQDPLRAFDKDKKKK